MPGDIEPTPEELVEVVVAPDEHTEIVLIDVEDNPVVIIPNEEEVIQLRADPGEPGARGPRGPAGAAGAAADHGDLSNVGPNDHHDQVHAIDGPDHTGNLSHASLNDLTVGNPHTQYRLANEDHTHVSTGAQGGRLDHGAALTGLGDDDHPQYLKEKGSGGLASEVPAHDHSGAAEAGTIDASAVDHGGLSGLTDDDHTIYLKEKASGGTAAEVPEHDHSADNEGGKIETDARSLADFEGYERLIIVAHRGDMNSTDGWPEGTLEGYRQAAIKGVNRVDLDVRLNADGTWYIMHDATVDRTTNGTGTVVSKTDAQMNALVIDGGSGYNAGRHSSLNLHPPTLAAVLDALAPFDLTYQLDVKVAADAGTMAQFVLANNLVHRVVMNAYTQDAYNAIKAVDSRIQVIGYDIPEFEFDDYSASDVLNVAPKRVNVVIPIEDFGSADEAAAVQTAFDRGVRSITVNDIDAALERKRQIFGGVADHGDLKGLSDDDHEHYLKEKASGGLASEVPTHSHTSAAEAGRLRYRQFVYEVSGNDFTFVIDATGNPVMALEDFE